MEELRIVVSNGVKGKVLTNSGVEYFYPAKKGRYNYEELSKLEDINYREGTFEDKIEYIKADFSWGRIINVHTIGEYQIIEYMPRNDKENKVLFHPYIKFNDTHTSYETLDKAITGVIFEKYEGHMNQLNFYVWRMIDSGQK